MAAYTTVDKVLLILSHRDDLDNQSVITTKEIRSLINSVHRIVISTLKIAGHDVESEIESDAEYLDHLEVIESLMAAGWVEQRLKADNGGDEGDLPNNNFYKQGNNLLKQLAENNEFDEISIPEDVINALVGSDNQLHSVWGKTSRNW